MQLRLPGVDPPQQVQAAPDRLEPAFWVRRICVLEELKAGAEHVVRNIELRRGFNIIWAPTRQPEDGNALFKSGVAGHTAGKSTLCRLIRYVLGEHSFATDKTRKRIREKFPDGWVVAEVVVAGAAWGVARPFGVGAHPFCISEGTLEQALDGGGRLPYQAFLDDMADAVLGGLPTRAFPSSGASLRWEHILPWLSRDQECRFADFLEWRHSSSGADAPSLSVEDRQFVLRSVLGLITDEERQEQQTNARLLTKRKEAAEQQPLLSHQAAIDHGRVRALLGIELDPPGSGLFGSQARTVLERRTVDLEGRVSALTASDRRTDLQVTLEQAITVEANARRDVDDTDTRLTAERAAVDQLTAGAAGDGQAALLAELPPPSGYCSVPMSLARERDCPLAVSRPIDFAARRSDRTAAQELVDHQKIVASIEVLAETKRQAHAQAKAATSEARRTFFTANTSYDEQRGLLLEERARLAQVERLVRDAEQAWNQSTEHAEAVKELGRAIDASQDRQDQIRRAGREALERFSATFDYVVRAIIGDEVVALVDTSGRSLSLVVDHHGERESAALETVKLLAFDLAALTESVQGRGSFPRFLVHDGPREADMAPDIYERLFLYARQLERCFDGEPSFQYILTTTTSPPSDFLVEPWLRLRLSGEPAEERLLGCDL
jgi:hypothetical protein